MHLPLRLPRETRKMGDSKEPHRALAYTFTQKKDVTCNWPVPAVHRHQLRRAEALAV